MSGARQSSMLAAVVLIALASAACVPWTVRPIEQGGETRSSDKPFDASKYVDGIWASKLQPALADAAVDLNELLRPDARRTGAIVVKGEGRVLRVDTASRVGKAFIDAPPYDGRPDAELQIGPVIRGTTVRDASGFVSFNDFQSQIEYAAVANELNARVLRDVLTPAVPQLTKGRVVRFTGTLAAADIAAGVATNIVPVQISFHPEGKQ